MLKSATSVRFSGNHLLRPREEAPFRELVSQAFGPESATQVDPKLTLVSKQPLLPVSVQKPFSFLNPINWANAIKFALNLFKGTAAVKQGQPGTPGAVYFWTQARSEAKASQLATEGEAKLLEKLGIPSDQSPAQVAQVGKNVILKVDISSKNALAVLKAAKNKALPK